MYLAAQFDDMDHLAAAIRALKAAGAPDAGLEIFSAEPVELPPGLLDRPSRMSLAAVAGGALSGTLLTTGIYWAQHDYPLVTGGMPIFSFWATGIISYEMTMLGAVLTTFGWFLWESGLLRRSAGPAPRVMTGVFVLRVQCDEAGAAVVSEAFLRCGAGQVEAL